MSDEDSNAKLLSQLKDWYDVVVIPKHGWNEYYRKQDKYCIIDLDYVKHGSYNWTPTANFNGETLATTLDKEFVNNYVH